MIFNVQGLPAGRCERKVTLDENDLELSDEIRFLNGDLTVFFYKTNHFIEIRFNVEAAVEMICDRSLNKFEKKLSGKYHLLYEPGVQEYSDSAKGGVRGLDVHQSVIDISDEVRDTVMLEVPVRKIHPDIEDSGSFGLIDQSQSDSISEKNAYTDPRWSALNKLKQNK